MKPFRLAGLMKVRKLEEDQAAAELARRTIAAQVAATRRESSLSALTTQYLPDQSDARSWQVSVAARAAASAALTDARAAERSASHAEDGARLAWNGAHTATSVLSKLEHRHVVEQTREELEAEQKVLDEIAQRHGRLGA